MLLLAVEFHDGCIEMSKDVYDNCTGYNTTLEAASGRRFTILSECIGIQIQKVIEERPESIRYMIRIARSRFVVFFHRK
jgi:hypothetical protein